MSNEVSAIRQHIVTVALSQIGSHYLKGGYGNTPGRADGHPHYPNRIKMEPEDLSVPNLKAAVWANGWICGGRFGDSDVKSRPKAEKELFELAWVLKGTHTRWPRRAKISSEDIREVWGESCENIRHFDCIGFINWCVWKALNWAAAYDISQWGKSITGCKVDDNVNGAEAGDILLRPDSKPQHIAIAMGNRRIVHASQSSKGVIQGPLPTSNKFTKRVHIPDRVLTKYGASPDSLEQVPELNYLY